MNLLILCMLSVWNPTPYNWVLCYSDGPYDFYVGAEWLCRDDAIHLTGNHSIRMLPRFGMKDCLGGPDTSASDDCLMYDYDGDGSVTLRDVWIRIKL